jgi:hypothetical protein
MSFDLRRFSVDCFTPVGTGPCALTSLAPIVVLSLLASFAGPVLSQDELTIVDDGAQQTVSAGKWETSTLYEPFGGAAHYARRYGAYRFTPAVPEGRYNVYLRWTKCTKLSKTAPVKVKALDKKYLVTMNQKVNGGRWNLVGTYDLGPASYVQVHAFGNSPVCVDALLLEPEALGGPPAAPAGLSATGGDGVVSLDWSDSPESDLASYSVYRSLTPDGTFTLVADDLTQSAYTDSTVTSGTTYYYVVTAVDTAGGESENSSVASAAPTGGGGDPGTGTVTLAWDAPTTNEDGTPIDDLGGFKVYVGSSSGQYSRVLDPGNVTDFTVEALSAGAHFFAVTAYDLSGNESAFSNEVAMTIE